MLNKLQLQNLAWTSTSKSWEKCSKSEQKLSFMTKPQLPNQQAVANMILSINISNSNNLSKFWVGIFTCQGHINQVYQKFWFKNVPHHSQIALLVAVKSITNFPNCKQLSLAVVTSSSNWHHSRPESHHSSLQSVSEWASLVTRVYNYNDRNWVQ